MQFKKGLEISTNDFWYDLSTGGYLKPRDMLINEEDIQKVEEAIRVIMDFEDSCEDQIEEFFQ